MPITTVPLHVSSSTELIGQIDSIATISFPAMRKLLLPEAKILATATIGFAAAVPQVPPERSGAVNPDFADLVSGLGIHVKAVYEIPVMESGGSPSVSTEVATTTIDYLMWATGFHLGVPFHTAQRLLASEFDRSGIGSRRSSYTLRLLLRGLYAV